MRVPINMGVKGKVTATLTNIETGEKQEVKRNNLILNHYLDWAMERGLGVLGAVTFNRCYIGTGTTPPRPDDTIFNGVELAMSASGTTLESVEIPGLFSLVDYIDNMHISATSGLAVTQSDDILILGRDSNRPAGVLGIEAFLIDKQTGNLSPLSIDAFSFSKDDGVTYQTISAGGNYVFVGMDQPPYGKLFEYVGEDFIFLGDVPGLTFAPTSSDISPDGSHLALVNSASYASSVWVYEISGSSIVRQSTHNQYQPATIKFSPSGLRLGVSSMASIDVIMLELVDGSYSSIATIQPGIGTNRSWAFEFVRDDLVVVLTNISSRGIALYKYEPNNWTLVSSLDSTVVTAPTSLDAVTDSAFVIGGGFIDLKLSGGSDDKNRSFTLGKPLPNLGINFSPDVNASIAYTNEGKFLFLRVPTSSGNALGIYSLRDRATLTQKYSRQWTFPAGVGTGIVNRVGLQANSATGAGGNNRHVAQIVLPEPLEKTDLHQLDVIWEIEVKTPGVWEGVIPGGSRDKSDLAWRVTINEEQFYDLVRTGYRILANWFGVTGTPNIRIGTSNEESDLIFDRDNIKGELIEYISSTALSVVNPYVPGSLKRTIRVFLEVDQGIGQIGEIVLGGSESASSLARITFDPPLDKPPDVGPGANPYRIYFDLEIGWQRGE